MTKPYRTGVSLETIIEDGWSRGFDVEQTVEEAHQMGFSITADEVKRQWNLLDTQFNQYE